MRRTALLLLTLTAFGAAPAATASASVAALLADCKDNERIDGKYSQKEFAATLRDLPTDVLQYTDCRDVINRARLASAGASGSAGTGGSGGTGAAPGVGGSGSAGGVAPPATAGTENVGKSAEEVLKTASPAERSQVAQAQKAAAPVQVGDRSLSPVVSGLSPAGAANVVPTPLAVALVLLGVGLVAGAAQLIRSRVLARRAPPA